MRDHLPKFFGYMGCGILVYDKLKNELFSDPEFSSSTQSIPVEDTLGDDSSAEEDIEIGLTSNI